MNRRSVNFVGYLFTSTIYVPETMMKWDSLRVVLTKATFYIWCLLWPPNLISLRAVIYYASHQARWTSVVHEGRSADSAEIQSTQTRRIRPQIIEIAECKRFLISDQCRRISWDGLDPITYARSLRKVDKRIRSGSVPVVWMSEVRTDNEQTVVRTQGQQKFLIFWTKGNDTFCVSLENSLLTLDKITSPFFLWVWRCEVFGRNYPWSHRDHNL